MPEKTHRFLALRLSCLCSHAQSHSLVSWAMSAVPTARMMDPRAASLLTCCPCHFSSRQSLIGGQEEPCHCREGGRGSCCGGHVPACGMVTPWSTEMGRGVSQAACPSL